MDTPLKTNLIKQNATSSTPVALPPTTAPFTYKTDLSQIPVLYQAQEAACVEHAIAGYIMWLVYSDTGKIVKLSPRFLGALAYKVDRLPLNQGTRLTTALNLAIQYGICEDQYFPNDSTLPPEQYWDFSKITPEAYANALQYRISGWSMLSKLDEDTIQNAIYHWGLVLYGIDFDQQWYTRPDGVISWQASDILPIRPPKSLPTASTHLVLGYGYDTVFNDFRNSFGPTWGQGGDGWFGANELPQVYEAAIIGGLISRITNPTALSILAVKNWFYRFFGWVLPS